MTLRSVNEVKEKVADYVRPKRWTCDPLVKRALDWALEKMTDESMSHYAEYLIRERIILLEEKQEEKEPLGFATKPARAVSINALKWVIGEFELGEESGV